MQKEKKYAAALALASGIFLIGTAASAQAHTKIENQKLQMSNPFYIPNSEKVAQICSSKPATPKEALAAIKDIIANEEPGSPLSLTLSKALEKIEANIEREGKSQGSRSITLKEALAAIKVIFDQFFNTEACPNPENVQYIFYKPVLGSPFEVPYAAINFTDATNEPGHYYGDLPQSEVGGVVFLFNPPTPDMENFFNSKNLKWFWFDLSSLSNASEVQAITASLISGQGGFLFDRFIDPTVGLSSFENSGNLNVYPNPALRNGSIRLQLSLPSRSNVKIEIFNTIGQLVYTGKALVEPGDKEISVPLGGLASGLYILKALNGDREIGTQKIVIQ